MKSKESEILELFFNEPSKEWHFSEIKSLLDMPDNNISRWLKKFIDEKLIIKYTPKNKMPYYVSNNKGINYRIRKKIFAMEKLKDSGLFDYLEKKGVKTIILFGSFSRSDWYKGSDIDIFIEGGEELDLSHFEEKLGREIQIFRKDIDKIMRFGQLIKGEMCES